MMVFVAFAANAQYKGASYLQVSVGSTLYDNIDGRISFDKAPQPNIFAGLSYGYLCTNVVTLDVAVSFRNLTNDYIKSQTYAVSPALFFKAWNKNKCTLSFGVGFTGGMQTLKLKDADNYYMVSDGSQYDKEKEFIYGVFLSPKFEYKFVDNWALTIQAAPELQFNSVRKMNYPVSLGIKWYM